MFGLGFKSKVLKVLDAHFNIIPNNTYMQTLPMICNEAKSQHQNEFSAAIMLVMVMMNAMPRDGSEQVVEFIEKHTKNIKKVLHESNSPEAEIFEMLTAIREDHGLSKKS